MFCYFVIFEGRKEKKILWGENPSPLLSIKDSPPPGFLPLYRTDITSGSIQSLVGNRKSWRKKKGPTLLNNLNLFHLEIKQPNQTEANELGVELIGLGIGELQPEWELCTSSSL